MNRETDSHCFFFTGMVKTAAIKDSHTRLIAAQIPKSELQIIPGSHFIANKNPEMFNEVVLRFLLR